MTRILGAVTRVGRDNMGLLLILAMVIGCSGQESEEEMLYYEDIESQEIRNNWESYPLGNKNQEN